MPQKYTPPRHPDVRLWCEDEKIGSEKLKIPERIFCHCGGLVRGYRLDACKRISLGSRGSDRGGGSTRDRRSEIQGRASDNQILDGTLGDTLTIMIIAEISYIAILLQVYYLHRLGRVTQSENIERIEIGRQRKGVGDQLAVE